MAVTQIKEIAAGRDGDESFDGESAYKRIFRIRCDSPADNAATVKAALKAHAGATPADAYPGDGNAYPKKYAATQEHGMLIWLGTIDYSTDLDDPLAEPSQLNVTGQLFSEVMVRDANGDPVLNSAGDPFLDPPVERDRAKGQITFSKNVATPPAWVFSLQNTLNLAGFSIWGGAISVAASKARFREPGVSGPHTRNGVTYYTVTGTIDVDPDGWDAHILDAGWREIDPTDATKRRACRNGDGTETQQVVPLNGSGFQLVNPSTTNATVLTFERYLPTAWTALLTLLS